MKLPVPALGFLLALAPLGAQITPEAPIRDFRLPMFGETGFKAWELQGDEGRYIDEDNSEILGLRLTVFAEDANNTVDYRIESPHARIRLNDSWATGNSSLTLVGPGFSLHGEDWTWNGEARTLTIQRKTRMILEGEIEILK